jgi:hypothetical protein
MPCRFYEQFVENWDLFLYNQVCRIQLIYNKLTVSTFMLVTNWYAVTLTDTMIVCSRACM